MITSRVKIILCGLICMVLFIYIANVLFTVRFVPDQYNQFEFRSSATRFAYPVWKTLVCLTFPAWAISQFVYEPYWGEVVYFPLLGGIIWFGYGCLFRWAVMRGKGKELSFALIILWGLLLYGGWIKNVYHL